jgi:hypothetical protein
VAGSLSVEDDTKTETLAWRHCSRRFPESVDASHVPCCAETSCRSSVTNARKSHGRTGRARNAEASTVAVDAVVFRSPVGLTTERFQDVVDRSLPDETNEGDEARSSIAHLHSVVERGRR